MFTSRRQHQTSVYSLVNNRGSKSAKLWLALAAYFLSQSTLALSEETADGYVEFVTDFGANCVARSAKQILVANNHPSKSIKIKLFRYFGDVRQPGRAAYTLEPEQEPLALGCDKIQGRTQRWEMHKAEFVEVNS